VMTDCSAALARQEDNCFRALTELALDFVVVIDLAGVVRYVSPAITRVMGYLPGEVVGRSFLDFVHPEDRPAGREDLARWSGSRDIVAVNLRFRHKDGSLRVLETSGVPIFGDAGAFLGFRGIDRDITAHRRAEEALRLQAFVQIIPDHVWRLDLEPPVPLNLTAGEQLKWILRGGRLAECNDAAAQALGYEGARDVRGKQLRELFGESAGSYNELILKGIQSGYRLTNFEQRTQDSHGNPQWHLCNVVGMVEDGCLVCAWGIERDITERKREQEEREQLEERLRQSQQLESIGRLAGGLAHEYNNLLTVINGYGDLLLGRLNESNPLRAPVEQIRKAGERAAALTRQLLAFSRKQVLQPQPLDLNALVAEHEDMFRGLADAGVEVVTRLEPSLHPVLADGAQIRQVLLNLVANAREAMPSGGVLRIETANVDVDAKFVSQHPEAAPGSYVLLAITDSGTGMDPEARRRIFEPFFAGPEAGSGTGLELPVVHGIVRQSEGWISVRSEPGVGTTFQIYLPRSEEPIPAADAFSPAGFPARNPETILVVEDQEAVRRLTVEVLKTQGYLILEAASGEEALHVAGRHSGSIHLMVSDVLMPGMSGRDLADRLAPLRPRMKVLFMSGYTEDVIAQRGVLDAGLAFISKPFAPKALALKVRDLLGPSRPNRILVVDDEPGIRHLFEEILRAEGYEVRTAANGIEALKRLKESACDLVITDLVMPEQEGIETIQAIRSDYPEARIIAISGQFEGRFLQVARMMGAQAALLKPIRSDELLDTVKRVLE
ncbi:MAG: response regulator, partial [Acidobacteria bacterium]|nr:response regulator [Acidobacteriota bacterium]